MSFICGFFNSVDGDRKYSADLMNRPYHRLVSNGVFAKPDGSKSNDFQVIGNNDMTVTILAGEGIFAGKWGKLDADMLLNVASPDATMPRIDSVIVRIDNSINVRAGSIYIKQGTPATSPIPPKLTRDANITEYRLANIRVEVGATAIVHELNVTDTRMNTEDCGFVTALLNQYDLSATYLAWEKQFSNWFNDLKQTVSTATLISSYTSRYVTQLQDETEIPVNITAYNPLVDILQVFINGLKLAPDGIDYTVFVDENTQNEYIRLTKPVDKGTPIDFVVYKSVSGELEGQEVETVIDQVNDLYGLFDMTKVTSAQGGFKFSVSSGADVLTTFVNKGIGFHTMYVANGAIGVPKTGVYRMFGHITDTGNGWLIAMQIDGSVYSNYLNGGTWGGWRVIYEANPTALYTGSVYMQAGQSISPRKRLSECQHGWLLVWSDYDAGTGTASKNDTVTTMIPKLNAQAIDWNGSSILCAIPHNLNATGGYSMVVKRIYVFDDHIEGYAGNNSTNESRDVVLRAVYEY